jgi:hypothetical protein
MWRNVFIESCILSALIFGGIYFNAALLKEEISGVKEGFHDEASENFVWTHVSGMGVPIAVTKDKLNTQTHISGNIAPATPVSPISGADQPPLTFAN